MSTAVIKLENRFTFRQYRTWGEDEQWELIYGAAYCRSPAPRPVHQAILGALFICVSAFFKGRPGKVYFAPFDVRIPAFSDQADDDIDTVVQPDLLVIEDVSRIDRHGLRGAPDLAVEILSPSTLRKDLVLKRAVYEDAGIGELWIVDPDQRRVLRYFRTATGFSPAERVDHPSIFESRRFPGLRVNLSEIFAE
jgi:Uma2 family endonuclease